MKMNFTFYHPEPSSLHKRTHDWSNGAGGIVGATIDSRLNKTAINGLEFKSATRLNIYIDSLTGDFFFQY